MGFDHYHFWVAGIPRPQGSMRALVPKGRKKPVVFYQNRKKLLEWKAAIASAAPKGVVYEGPVGLWLTFGFPLPEIDDGKKKRIVRNPRVLISKPDLDKLIRAVLDALTGVLFRDDGQVTVVIAKKLYMLEPGVEIEAHCWRPDDTLCGMSSQE